MDYKFALRCWQDKEGSENAKINVFVNGTQILTEAEVSAENNTTPSIISFDGTGLADPNTDGSVTCNIKVVLANDYYVDADTDRNVHIDGLAYLTKDGSDFKKPNDDGTGDVTVTDFASWDNFPGQQVPTNVTGDQIPADWNDSSGLFHTITVWGGDDGVTITCPLTKIFRAPNGWVE
jgi:hypothetical protein